MSQPTADRNLLFGMLALQMDFITREQLIAAMQAWVFDKSKPLGEILCAQKALAPDNRPLLEALMQKHLAKHNNDPEKSLAAVSSAADVKKDLQKITDPDVQASLIHVAAPRAKDVDVYATVAPSARMAAATGMRFRILRPHAKGGLGEVFVAHDEELHREVALKEIQGRQADDQDSRARFMLEAEITGGLEHPGIVPVYGLGTYGDGRPYYAMRFIRGDSLKDAIERFHKNEAAGMAPGQRTLELRGLLGRFVDVCNAIAYAHSRGVLHRDLKPGNIMLGKYGETLVVDWGLAKPLGEPKAAAEATEPGEGSLIPHSISSSSQTLMGSALGTPQYMSPEQASGRLDQLGPASDVYSLGATLFCLLTGQPSITETDVGSALQKVQRGEIRRPSEIKKNVPAPLEAVCLKAMALKPQDRYASPRGLADDIEHWLADEPVSAWSEPWTVKTRRWIGQHSLAVTGAASAAVVALVALTIATLLLTAANERERQARAKAEHNFKLARQAVDRYHTDVSESVLLHEPGMQPLRKKLLEAAREFYDQFVKEHGNDPALEGELGKATFRLAQITGDIDSELDAIKLHEQAIKIFEKLPANQTDAATPYDLAASWHHLGRLNRLLDRKDQSEKAYEIALALWQQQVKEHPQEDRYQAGLARTQLGLGNVQQVARHLDQAQKFYQQALEIRTSLAQAHPKIPEYQRDVAVTYNNLALVYKATGQDKDAEKAYQAALVTQKKLVDDAPHISQYQDDLARTNANLGDLYARIGPASQAEAFYREAAKLRQKLVDRHPAVTDFQSTLAEAYAALATVYRNSKEPKKAEDVCQQALAIQRKLATEHPGVPARQDDLGRGLFVLAEVYRTSGQLDKAETAYLEAIPIQRTLVTELPKVPHYQSALATTYNSLGMAQAKNKKPSQADEAFKNAQSRWDRLVKEHADVQEYSQGLFATSYNLGNLSRDRGQLHEALDWYALALSHARETEKPFVQVPRTTVLARLGKYMEATTEASQLAAKTRQGDYLYRFAAVYSLSSAAAAADDKRPPEERHKLAEQFAAQAVKLLADAGNAGLFKKGAAWDKLQTDPDLKALRARPDFQKLSTDLKSN